MTKISFNQLSENQQRRHCTIPQHVSSTKNPDDETFSQVSNRQSIFITLPDEIREKLSSLETGRKIEEIGKKYSLSLLETATLARAVRCYYFKKINQSEISEFVLSELKNLDSRSAQEISNSIVESIINSSQTAQNFNKTAIEQLPIPEAVRIYPEINEQLITSQPIRMKNYPEAVRPSIKNWIADYTFQLGYDHHDSIMRGNFIFKSENGKNLTQNDRRRLSEILKSFDEKSPLSVDPATKQIVFPALQERKSPERQSFSPSLAKIQSNTVNLKESAPVAPLPQKDTFFPSQKTGTKPAESKESIDFSSPQKLPVEKEQESPEENPQPMRIRPVSSNTNRLWKREVPSENIVNLKE